jgi:3-oxoacyl-[acyl-carrier protein] reductase
VSCKNVLSCNKTVAENFRDIPLEEFEYTLNVNLKASFILVKGVVEGMKAQKWGRIIFVSSIAAYGGGINGCRKLSTFLP